MAALAILPSIWKYLAISLPDLNSVTNSLSRL